MTTQKLDLQTCMAMRSYLSHSGRMILLIIMSSLTLLKKKKESGKYLISRAIGENLAELKEFKIRKDYRLALRKDEDNHVSLDYERI